MTEPAERPQPPLAERRFGLLAVGAFASAAILGTIGLGDHVLLDVDEPKFAAASREMARGGDAVVPHFNGAERFDKPILIYWLQALAMRLFGEGEFAARLPSVLSVAGTVPLAAAVGRLLGLRASLALLAGLAVGASGVAQVLARGATADALLLFTTTLLAWLQLRAAGFAPGRQHAPLPGAWWLAWLVAGLAFLVKGPPALVGPLSLAAGLVAAGRRPRPGRVLLGALLAGAVVLAWAVPALLRSEGRFWTVGVLHHVVDRSLVPFEGHGGYAPWWYLFYVVAIPAGLLPFSAFLWKLRDVGRGDLFRPVPEARPILLWWIGGVFAVFTLATSKLVHYPLPGYPAWAVMILLAIQQARGTDGRGSRADRLAGGTLLAVGVVLAAACIAVFPGFGLEAPGSAIATAAWFLLGLGLAGLRAARGRTVSAARITAATSLIGFAALTVLVVGPFFSASLGARVRAARSRWFPPETRVVTFELPMPSLSYYLDRRIERSWELDPEGDPVAGALRALQSPGTVVLARADRVDRLQAALDTLGDPAAAAIHGALRAPPARLRGFLPSKGKVLEVLVIPALR